MVIESAIHDAKGLSRQFSIFKRPRKGETRFDAAMRKLMGQTWLRHDCDREIAHKEIHELPSMKGEISEKFVKLRVLSEGAEKFDLSPADPLRATSAVMIKRSEIVLSVRENVSPNLNPPPAPPVLTPEEKKRRDRFRIFSRLTIAQLKIELRDRSLPVRGLKPDLITRLVNAQ
jgi:hypothetical protein